MSAVLRDLSLKEQCKRFREYLIEKGQHLFWRDGESFHTSLQ